MNRIAKNKRNRPHLVNRVNPADFRGIPRIEKSMIPG